MRLLIISLSLFLYLNMALSWMKIYLRRTYLWPFIIEATALTYVLFIFSLAIEWIQRDEDRIASGWEIDATGQVGVAFQIQQWAPQHVGLLRWHVCISFILNDFFWFLCYDFLIFLFSNSWQYTLSYTYSRRPNFRTLYISEHINLIIVILAILWFFFHYIFCG